jgi:3D (Asp-Asp-Asp) domain-containing protein
MPKKRKSIFEKYRVPLISYAMTLVAVVTVVAIDSYEVLHTTTAVSVKQEGPKELVLTGTCYVPAGPNNALARKPVVGKDIAVSRDNLHLLGKKVYITCDSGPGNQEDIVIGMRTVTDLMHRDISNAIDITVPSEKMARAFGKRACYVVPVNE